MSVFSGDIAKYMDKLAPLGLAENWDNVGLLLGNTGKEVKKLLVSLDVTSPVVAEAVENCADIIVTHHPLIFKGIKSLNTEDPKTRILFELIKKDICVYSAHTNLDAAEGGLNDFLAAKLGLKSVKNLYELLIDGKTHGMGKVGLLENALRPEKFMSMVRNTLDAQRLKIIGKPPEEIRKVAVLSGSFDENYSGLLNSGIDVLVTGDVKYHAAVDISERELYVVDAGHYNTERIVVELLVQYLTKEFPGIEVVGSQLERDPFSFY